MWKREGPGSYSNVTQVAIGEPSSIRHKKRAVPGGYALRDGWQTSIEVQGAAVKCSIRVDSGEAQYKMSTQVVSAGTLQFCAVLNFVAH